MEHLPPVEDPALPLLEVDYLCTDLPYDQGKFEDYPTRRGIDLNHLEEMLKGKVVASEAEWARTSQFLQSWLYFGLLWEFYQHIFRPNGPDGIKIITTLLTREIEAGDIVISNAKLLSMLDLWVSWNQKGPPVIRELVNKDTLTALDTTRHYIELVPHGNILEEIPTAPKIPQQAQDVLLSITILQLTLLTAYCEANGDSDGFTIGMPHILGSPFVTQRLLRAKWCPRLISQMSTHLAPLDLLYAGQLRRHGVQQNHGLCSVKECIHSQVDEGSYVTQHVPHCKGCQMLSVDEDQIATCLDKDSYPLVALETFRGVDGKPKLRLKVVDRSSDTPYVAISHVWSDGLGNPHSNSLPTCQISRLVGGLIDLVGFEPPDVDFSNMSLEEKRRVEQWNELQMQQGSPDVFFWIDTLCIPTQKHLKQKALSKLHDTYTNAKVVVVLDEELRNTTWQTPVLENLMRIRTSKWMTRLWTLEEAILTRFESLYVLFEGGMFALNGEMEEAKRHEDINHFLHRSIQLHTFRPFRRILRIKSISTAEKITELGHLMVTRSTTKKGDETLIIGTVLGLDIGILFNTPLDERTHKLLHLQRFWPTHILFNSMLNRLTTPGYRWAPKSFLGKGISHFMLGSGDLPFDPNATGEQISPNIIQLDEESFETDGGLLISLPGMRLQSSELPIGRELPTADGKKTYFWLFDVKSKAWYGVLHTQHPGDQQWVEVRNAPMRTDRRMKLSIVFSVNVTDGRYCTAALVAVYGAGDDGRVLYAEFRCLLTIFRASSTSTSMSGFLGGSGFGTVPMIDSELPAKRELCEQILGDVWDGNGTTEEILEAEVRDEDERKVIAETVKTMLCPAWTARDGQNWCIG